MMLRCGCGNEMEFTLEIEEEPPVEGMGTVAYYPYHSFSILTAMEGEVIGIQCHSCGEMICFYE